MKNILKRILLLLPVISVLFVLLAVPAVAAGSLPSTIGVVEPSTVKIILDDAILLDYQLGSVIDYDDVSFNFRYRITIDAEALLASTFSSGVAYEGAMLIGPLNSPEVPYSVYFLSDGLLVRENSNFFVFTFYGTDSFQSLGFINTAGSDVIYIWLEEWPLETATDLFYEMPIIAIDEIGSPSPTESIGNVWTDIMIWITSALNSVMGAFYVDGSLTLLGTLAVIGVSVGIGFLLIGIIQRFLKLRG